MPPRALILLAPILLLAGCIEGEEEIWLERNGSGRLSASYSMPVLLMNRIGGADKLAQQLEAASSRDPHVELTRVMHRQSATQVTFEFEGTFDDFRKLVTFPRRQLRDPALPDTPVGAEVLFGDTRLDIDLFALSLQREIDLGPLLPAHLEKLPALPVDSSLRYIVHLPVAATRHNATSISPDGKRLEWNFPLRNHLKTPMQIEVHAPLPVPWWLLTAGAILGVAVLLLLFRLLRRRS